MSKEYTIGRHRLLLPIDHALDGYQSTWRRYDTALAYIAQVVLQKYPETSAIDIGANVGDSAALIQQHQDVLTLCVEGNPEYLEYLEHNAAIIGNVEIEECFVGNDGTIVNFGEMQSQGGTSSIVNALNPDGLFLTETKSLATILQAHPTFQNSKLLKIDTDGFDFVIIQDSIRLIHQLKPVIYFEYDISFKPEGAKEGFDTLRILIENGYEKFIVYDNFGNYLISLSSQNNAQIVDLNAYLLSNRFKSGTPAVYYFDICAFCREDTDLFDRIRYIETDQSPA